MTKTAWNPKDLVDARKRLGHSQRDAAESIRVPQDTLQKWEQGRREPTGLYREAVDRYIKGSTRRRQ